MRTKETFYRPEELLREPRKLPAHLYNLTRIVLKQSPEEAVFIPIRCMLYLAVVDVREIIFLDGAGSPREILLSWQNFRPGRRTSLDEPVAYEAVYYSAEAPNLMPRLSTEFPKALRMMKARRQENQAGLIIPLKG